MTLTMHERIIGVVKGLQTEDEYLISSLLGISPADVAHALQDSTYEPSAPGGSGSSFTNALQLTVTVPVLNTSNDWYHRCVEGDLAVQPPQRGTDLSIGTSPDSGKGCVLSAAGGVFQAVAYIAPQEFGGVAVALDVGSSKQRFVWAGASVGSTADPFGGLGINLQVPVVAAANDPNGINQMTAISPPGIVAPGGPALDRITFAAIQPFGTDSIPLNISMGVWQVA